MHMMRKALIGISFIFAFWFASKAQVTAKIDIKVENFSYLQIQDFAFFVKDNEFSAKKIDQGLYTVDFFSTKPKLLFMNTHAILISPGDSIQLTYRALNRDPDNWRDTIIVKGKNAGNYTFSNFNYRMPKGFYPDIKEEKYAKDPMLIYRDLSIRYKKYVNDLDSALSKLNTDRELINHFKREATVNFLFDLMGYETTIANLKNGKIALLSKSIDSIFTVTKFNPIDTTYKYTTENLFQKYLGRIIKTKYNNLSTKSDFDSLVKYIDTFPDDFVKEYFFYFLATDFKYIISKYYSETFNARVANNSFMKRTRFDFWVNKGIVN
jgi:hypothetical protein